MASKRVTTSFDQLTYAIIGCAMAVHRERGPGYREDTYQRDLEVHLAERGLAYQSQHLLGVFDSDQGNVLIGYYVPDFIVGEQVVVEIKALSGIDNSHVALVIGYLAVTYCPVGLLVNFGARSLKWRPIFPPKNIIEHRINRQWLFVPEWLKNE